ncbi:MAG TPA: hypothetical protein VFN09_01500 [Rhodanobacteraceae bacterium]|nr:hypothetical protein [Rhodanobacteraceae bacterium]
MGNWLLAASVIVAVVAIIVAWRQHQAAGQWRQLAAEAEAAMHGAQESLEQSRVRSTLGDVLLAVAERLPDAARAQAPDAGANEAARETVYRHVDHVREYDAAVQNCLQPVELMPGADEADLEHLLKFVSTARTRLFDARAQLLSDGTLDQLPTLIPAEPSAAQEPPALLTALAGVTAASRGDTSIGQLLHHLDTLTRARCGERLTFSLHAPESLSMPAPMWLSTVLLRLLDTAVELAGDGGEVALVAQQRDDHGVDIEGHAQPQRSLRAETYADYETKLDDLRHRLDERGVVLQANNLDPRSRGYVLRLAPATAAPVVAPVAASPAVA